MVHRYALNLHDYKRTQLTPTRLLGANVHKPSSYLCQPSRITISKRDKTKIVSDEFFDLNIS